MVYKCIRMISTIIIHSDSTAFILLMLQIEFIFTIATGFEYICTCLHDQKKKTFSCSETSTVCTFNVKTMNYLFIAFSFVDKAPL